MCTTCEALAAAEAALDNPEENDTPASDPYDAPSYDMLSKLSTVVNPQAFTRTAERMFGGRNA